MDEPVGDGPSLLGIGVWLAPGLVGRRQDERAGEAFGVVRPNQERSDLVPCGFAGAEPVVKVALLAVGQGALGGLEGVQEHDDLTQGAFGVPDRGAEVHVPVEVAAQPRHDLPAQPASSGPGVVDLDGAEDLLTVVVEASQETLGIVGQPAGGDQQVPQVRRLGSRVGRRVPCGSAAVGRCGGRRAVWR